MVNVAGWVGRDLPSVWRKPPVPPLTYITRSVHLLREDSRITSALRDLYFGFRNFLFRILPLKARSSGNGSSQDISDRSSNIELPFSILARAQSLQTLKAVDGNPCPDDEVSSCIHSLELGGFD